MENSNLDKLVQQVQKSTKYSLVAPDLMRRIGAQELAHRRKFKDAVKATKNKLHQVGGAYFETKVDYERALATLRESAVSPHPFQDESFRAACRDRMTLHASTRERLPILDTFYDTIFAHLPPIHHVIDVACGFNPLALPWMNLPPDVTYVAVDIYADMLHFLDQFFTLAGLENGRTDWRDVIGGPPTETADLALILKTLPCLEQVDKTAVTTLLDALQARYLLISYPAQSLGGRRKGMVETYAAHFQTLADGRPWQVQRFEFATELAFLVEVERP